MKVLLYAFFWVISRRRGITQKKTYNIQNTAKVWNQELHFYILTLWSLIVFGCTILTKVYIRVKASACQNVICWKFAEKFTFVQTLFFLPNWLLYHIFILLLLRKKCFKKFRPSWDMTLSRGISGFRLSEEKLGNIYPTTLWPTPKARNFRSHPCESLKTCKYFKVSMYGNWNIQCYAILFNVEQ
jgi:hypothetical protein